MKILNVLLISGLSVITAREAAAACGGGGWHQSSSAASKPAIQATEVRAEPVSYHSSNVSGTLGSFYARFEGVSAQLSLTDSQLKDATSAKDSVRNRIEKLEKRKSRAENKLAECTGDCEDETREVRRAADALQAYDAKAEFDNELKSILSSQQWKTYKSSIASK